MRRIGSPARSNPAPSPRRPAPPGWFAAPSFLALVVSTTPSWAGDDDRPELTPPLDAPTSANPPRLVNPTRSPIVSIPAAPSTPPPAQARPSTVTPSSAVLALPGLIGPASTLRPSNSPPPDDSTRSDARPDPTPDQDTESGITLDGPVEMRSGSTYPSTGRTNPPRMPNSEPTAIEDPSIDDRTQGPSSGSIPRRSTASSTPARRVDPVPPPPRRGRFFGLFPGPVVVPPGSLNTRPSTAGAIASGRDVGLPPEDVKAKAAAEAALKKRIEKQARDAVGARARSIEVHVDRSTAGVQVRGVKFYQKRAVRKAIESLPALSGLRSTIEVLD